MAPLGATLIKPAPPVLSSPRKLGRQLSRQLSRQRSKVSDGGFQSLDEGPGVAEDGEEPMPSTEGETLPAADELGIQRRVRVLSTVATFSFRGLLFVGFAQYARISST